MTEPRTRGAGRARRLVSAIVLFSLAVILFEQVIGGRDAPPVSTTPAGTTVAATPDPTAGGVTTTPVPTSSIRELLVLPPDPIGEPGAALPEMLRWPASGSVETIRVTDLTRYVGRPRTGKPLEGITVVLDPGHGGIDSGCGWPVGFREQDVMEKDVTLSVAQETKKSLESLGARVRMIRDDDTFYSIFCRPALVAKSILEDFAGLAGAAGRSTTVIDGYLDILDPIIEANDDMIPGRMGGSGTDIDLKHAMDIQRQYPDWLFISIHCNAAADYPDVHGLQVYYTTSGVILHDERLEAPASPSSDWRPSYQYYDDAGRLRLASLLYGSITKTVPALADGTPDPLVDQDFAVLREQNLASAMIELGFLTNENDRAALSDPAMQPRLGEAIADAVYSYYCVR